MEAMANFLQIPDSLRLRESEVIKENMLQTGFIAQEVEKAAHELGYDFSGVDKPKNENDYYGLRYAEFTVPLVKAVQELNAKTNAQEKLITEKDLLIEDLNERLTKIEQLLKLNENTSSLESSSECCNASLEQNFPNPFNQSTSIKYSISEDAKNAVIVISSIDGRELQRYVVNVITNGQLVIPANTFACGNYFYQLVVDGQQMDIKKMEIIK